MTRNLIVTWLRSRLSLCPLDSSPMTTTAEENARVISTHSVGTILKFNSYMTLKLMIDAKTIRFRLARRVIPLASPTRRRLSPSLIRNSRTVTFIRVSRSIRLEFLTRLSVVGLITMLIMTQVMINGRCNRAVRLFMIVVTVRTTVTRVKVELSIPRRQLFRVVVLG